MLGVSLFGSSLLINIYKQIWFGFSLNLFNWFSLVRYQYETEQFKWKLKLIWRIVIFVCLVTILILNHEPVLTMMVRFGHGPFFRRNNYFKQCFRVTKPEFHKNLLYNIVHSYDIQSEWVSECIIIYSQAVISTRLST